jgi:hypothetical protein
VEPWRTTFVRSIRVLVVPAVIVLTVTGCNPERTTDAQEQGSELMRAAELPIESVSFRVEEGGTVTASAQRWVASSRAPELDEGAVAAILWQRSIAEIEQIEVETIQDPTGRSLSLRRFSGQELTTRFGPRPAGVVQVTAEQIEREEGRFIGSVLLLFFGMPALFMVAGVVVAAILVVVVLLIVLRGTSAPGPGMG